MKKILVCIANHGDDQLKYLDMVLDSLNNFRFYDVTIIVHSSIPLSYNNIEVKICKLENPQMLPWECRKTILQHKNDFDLFLYTENDHLYKESHIQNFEKINNIFPFDNKIPYIPGFFQYEESYGEVSYPAYHSKYHWINNSVKKFDNYYFAQFSNTHHAGFLIDQYQLDFVSHKFVSHKLTFDNLNPFGYGSVKVKACTDIYGILRKMIPISHFDDFCIHHLPNKYIAYKPGNQLFCERRPRMEQDIKTMIESYGDKK